MELENRASVAAHAQLGWRSVGGFSLGEREYEVVVREVGKP
ncbi:hypothetical protein O6R08_03850 [Cutibacterium equinum]|uniref:Acetyltransferase, GNAT family n=1 Tax=Cutibacterium equinum TaxID=3016342 RepID=A0ABY7R005_9ACTN|nr:hypothetical protein [Cutibacterium equinum]WCC80633.1 hypothetical protein O6R08_03850 [Cutibacterium equinum]